MRAALARLLALAPVVILAAAACSGPAGSGHVSSAGGCGGGSTPDYLAGATVAFTGIMLPGATVKTGSGDVLVSPAKARVIRYLKGTGPPVVTIETGVRKSGGEVITNEDGIEPAAGQRWTIYASSPHYPYQTSVCMGSMRLSGTS
jgi:hypothetical protein